MGIQFYSGYLDGTSYQNYRRPDIATVSVEEVQKQDEEKNARESSLYTYTPTQDTRTKTADLENISLTFQKDASFDYLGSESNLENLDIQKAVSDMRKDSILQEYQYFVGSSQELLQSSEDGIVIPKF